MSKIQRIDARHRFHGVGQGLFVSGVIEAREDSGSVRRFDWVYDCGSVTKGTYLDDEVSRYLSGSNPGGAIDLLVISHFDRDHINGIEKLIAGRFVRTLLLPYIGLAARIRLAISQGVDASDPVFRFFTNPTQYIADIEGPGIGEILYVEGGDQPPPPDPPEEAGDPGPPPPPVSPEGDGDDRRRMVDEFRGARLAMKPSSPPILIGQGTAGSSSRNDTTGLTLSSQMARPQPDTGILAAGATLRVGSFWEFIPYNDEKLKGRVSKKFANEVANCAVALCSDKDAAAKKTTMDELKAKYDNTVAFNSPERNLISLFLGSRPLPSSWLDEFEVSIDLDYNGPPWSIWPTHAPWYPWHNYFQAVIPHFACILTGDGFLKTRKQVTALENRYGVAGGNPVASPIAFQIMHHGSRHNYQPGIASRIPPAFSIFSSDPTRKQGRGGPHPHAAVWQEYSRNRPLQVMQGVSAAIRVRYKR